jgi:NADPH:quinone reductase
MQAIGFQQSGDIDVLINIEQPTPTPEGRDLLIEIKAVSVNPVDVKVRQSAKIEPDHWKALGWDAAGIVTAIGPDVTLFQPGDEVFYAGAIDRPGTNAEGCGSFEDTELGRKNRFSIEEFGRVIPVEFL